MFSWIKYSAIVGEDIAGDVVEVGSGVTGFEVGDRVVGHSLSTFQTYPVIKEHMVSLISSSVSYEEASVIPLGLSTALMGLFHKDFLALQYPSIDPKPTGKTLLIWGGSTSVGSNAIQAAVAAGYEVITTA
jgi:NADPH:quinone reductase-like Zn-dependent oxidoreductase